MEHIIKKIIDKVKYSEEDSIIFDDQNKPTLKISKDNFHNITKIKSDKKIAFVDGGNLEILKTPAVSLFFNRVYYTIYHYNKRIENKLIEFYSLISAVNKQDNIFFKTEYFFIKNTLKIKEYEFDSFDKTLISGSRRASISVIGGVIRRFAELTIINDINSDIIIIDGSLEPKITYEKEIIDGLKKVVCGLSKTTELLTKKGQSVSAYFSNLKGYYDAGENLFFIKLHPKSKYIFRFETLYKYKINEILSLLKENSCDPIFLGYPYGLIEADRFARISNNEKKILQLQLQVKLKKDFKKIEPYINSINAHEVLDNIS